MRIARSLVEPPERVDFSRSDANDWMATSGASRTIRSGVSERVRCDSGNSQSALHRRRSDVLVVACKLTHKVSTLSYSVRERSRFHSDRMDLTMRSLTGPAVLDLDGPVAVHLQLDLGAVGPQLAAGGGLDRFHVMRHRHRWLAYRLQPSPRRRSTPRSASCVRITLMAQSYSSGFAVAAQHTLRFGFDAGRPSACGQETVTTNSDSSKPRAAIITVTSPRTAAFVGAGGGRRLTQRRIQCTSRSSSRPRGRTIRSTATRPPNTIMR